MPRDQHALKGVKRRAPRRSVPLAGVGLVLLAVLGFAVLLTPLGGKVKRGLKEILGSEVPILKKEDPIVKPGGSDPAPSPPEPLTPIERDPDPLFPKGVLTPPDGVDLRKLSKGINLKVSFESEEGGLASAARKEEGAYVAEYALKVRMPRAARTMEDLSTVNPDLGNLLPWLKELLPQAQVSPWYRQIYANKAERLKANVGRLDEILTRHNFYDCETMLNLRHEGSGRRVFLLQAEMDVVSDGSDGDRLPTMPDSIVNSTHYQPFTSFRWKKTGSTVNPMLAGWGLREENAKRELGQSGTSAERKRWLRERIKKLETGIEDMKFTSYLIAEYDPFIVIPTNILTDRKDPYAPNVGDFVVVVYGKTLYPAIVGDAGPTFKVGEASLRMARELNASAGPYRRPVSDLTVTYIVFPRSADDTKTAPDYGRWLKRCGELLEEVGGLGEGVELHEWKDLLLTP